MVGYSLGADDYVSKPFLVKVLLQRIKALLRRRGRQRAGRRDRVPGRQDRPGRHRAFANDRELDLTPTEFRLLECLLRQPGRAFTRHQLMDAAIGEGAIVLERTIDVHIKTLRRKLGEVDLIETVRGVGYRFREQLAGGVTCFPPLSPPGREVGGEGSRAPLRVAVKQFLRFLIRITV